MRRKNTDELGAIKMAEENRIRNKLKE